MCLYNILSTGQRREVLDVNFNLHKKGELHPDRTLKFHDIVYILEGGWEIAQDDSRYVLDQGDIIFLHAGHHHYGVNGYLPGAKTMYLHINCLREDSLAWEAEGKTPAENILVLPVVIKSHDSVTTRSLFEDIIFTYWSDMNNKSIRLAALVDLLLCNLSEADKQRTNFYEKLVEDALYLIRLTPQRIFTLAELSALLHVCSRSLTGKFKKVTGKSIHQYQIELKLEMAYMLIKDNPSRPFKEVAGNLGLYDEFHFSKLFKRKYGFSPSGLRRKSRE
jgi:AraC-like DNA-binding protein